MLIWIGAVLGATVAAFLVGGVWYGLLFGQAAAALNPAYADPAAMSLRVVLFEGLRCLAMAAALAVLVGWAGAGSIPQAMLLGFIVWAGFQAAGLAGAVVHEEYPFPLYAIHAGDALAKVLAASLILGAAAPTTPA